MVTDYLSGPERLGLRDAVPDPVEVASFIMESLAQSWEAIPSSVASEDGSFTRILEDLRDGFCLSRGSSSEIRSIFDRRFFNLLRGRPILSVFSDLFESAKPMARFL